MNEPTLIAEQRHGWKVYVEAHRDGPLRDIVPNDARLVVAVDAELQRLESLVARQAEEIGELQEALAAKSKELGEAYWTITGMRVQIQEWIDEGVSGPDMAAFLKENAG